MDTKMDTPETQPAEGLLSKSSSSETSVSPSHATEWEQPFPGYTVIEKIAQGGYGAVYRARDERFQREVAIKILLPDLAAHPDAVERFFAEARTTARLRHPHLVRGYDVGRSGRYLFYVMEYVHGESLAQKLERLERHCLSERESLEIIRPLAEVLQYIFEQGLVHRDVKPGNILLGEERAVKLCDLGIARELSYPDERSVVRGSPSYASPEQIREECDIDIRSDLYSLGCTWFHMLLGRPPFMGSCPEEILRGHLETPPPSPRTINMRITAATSELILWLLEKDRDQRPRTPAKFLEKLSLHPLLHAGSA